MHFGFVGKLPKMIGVQAEGCNPITGAFERGEKTVAAYENPQTVAHGICDPLDGYPLDGTRTLNAIRQSGGVGVSVDDELIMRYLYEIARKEAVFCEPASAAAVAAVDKLLGKGVIGQEDSVVSIITAHGLKDTDVIPEDEQHPVIRADMNEFQNIYQI
jgi:threonine synthase